MKQCKCCGSRVNDIAMYCPSCGATNFASPYGDNTYGTSVKIEKEPINNVIETPKKANSKQNIPLGVFGALLGFIIVSAAWCLLGKMGLYIRFQGVFFVLIPCAMYTGFSKRSNLVATVLICSAALLLLYPLERFTNICNVQKEYATEYDKEVDFDEASDLFEFHFKNQSDYKFDVIMKLVISYLCAILSVISYVAYTVKKEGIENGTAFTNDATIYANQGRI